MRIEFMPFVRAALPLIPLALLLIHGAAAQDQRTETSGETSPSQSDSRVGPPDSVSMRMPILLPLFLSDERFSSSLVMINPVNASTYADVSLRDGQGRQVASKRVTFAGQSQRRVAIADLLQESTLATTRGSIVITENPNLKSPVIAAALSMTYRSDQGEVYIDEEPLMASADGSNTLRAVSGETNGSPLLAISSLSQSTQRMTLSCITMAGKITTKTLNLLAGHTLFSQGCADVIQTPVDTETSLLGSSSDRLEPVGIEINSDGKSGDYSAFALALRSQHQGSLISSMAFDDPMMMKSPASIFVGVPIGSVPLLPNALYVPQITTANFDSVAHHVHVLLASTTNSTPVEREISTFLVAAHSTALLPLPESNSFQGIDNSYIVTSDGDPGAVFSKLTSRADSLGREVELLAKNDKDPQNGGNHPWSTQTGNQSTLLLFNHADEKEIFNVQISDGKAMWSKAYTLAPKETKTIDIRLLIEERVEDDSKYTLPVTLSHGVVNWFTLTPGAGRGRLLMSAENGKMARNFSCGAYTVICSVSIGISNSVFGVGATDSFGSLSTATCKTNSPSFCGGERGGSATAHYGWSSVDNSIASIAGSNSGPNSSVYGVGMGSTKVVGHVSGPYGCGGVGSGPANVCTASISPPSYVASTCSGAANHTVFSANVQPGLSQCGYNGSKSSCNIGNSTGNVDLVVPPTCSMSITPGGSFDYFAGPGTSGQTVGTVGLHFSLFLGSKAKSVDSNVNIQCP